VGHLDPLADGVPETPRGDYLARQAAALLATVADADHRASLRELFEYRAGVCEYCGGLPRAEAERTAFEELQSAIRVAGVNPKNRMGST